MDGRRIHEALLSTSPSVLLRTGTSEHVTDNGVVELSYAQLATLVLSLSVVLIVSYRLSLDVEKHLIVGAIRCFIQLSALGFILVPIIKRNYSPLVFLYIILMLFVAAVEASSRPTYVFDSLFLVCFVSIALAVTTLGVFTFTLVIPVGLDAQYAIPIIGMITGNAMSAVSVTISNIVNNLAEHKHDVELLLALGATRWEASMSVLKSSIKLGMTPMLNMMHVTGLVAIPGMMTGQIIGGTPPSTAAKYQLVIMYVVAGSATVSTLTAAFLTTGSPFPSHVHTASPPLDDHSDVAPKNEEQTPNYGSV